LVANGAVDVVFVPGTGGAALPALPAQVPGVSPPQPSGFDVTFAKVEAGQVAVSAASSAPETPVGIADPAPAASTDIPTSTDIAVAAPPDTNFNFAADAIQGASGTAAASQPSVNPGSLEPQQLQETASSDAGDNKGYRALAVLLLAALLWWAWRQAVPPRAGKRTIYDGPPATA
jgi:hypothetical protein